MQKSAWISLGAAGVLAVPLAAYAAGTSFQGKAEANGSGGSSGGDPLQQLSSPLEQGKQQLEQGQQQLMNGLEQGKQQLEQGKHRLKSALPQLHPPSGNALPFDNPLPGGDPTESLQKGARQLQEGVQQLQQSFQQGQQQVQQLVSELQQKLQGGSVQRPGLPLPTPPGGGNASASGSGALSVTLPGVGTLSAGFSGQGSPQGSSGSFYFTPPAGK
ncbi:hypothetical protein [Effusibacillus pohliae]|uniref:hypothetical protein n=1 Tax=Effusibacillus pohliae TaxID=232270 RepID=UPI000366434F|nr:hypothetical protein [Effusibacillus pohliae]